MYRIRSITRGEAVKTIILRVDATLAASQDFDSSIPSVNCKSGGTVFNMLVFFCFEYVSANAVSAARLLNTLARTLRSRSEIYLSVFVSDMDNGFSIVQSMHAVTLP